MIHREEFIEGKLAKILTLNRDTFTFTSMYVPVSCEKTSLSCSKTFSVESTVQTHEAISSVICRF